MPGKLTDFEISERIARIGGTGWVTVDDYRRFSRQATDIFYYLVMASNQLMKVCSRRYLEDKTGARRVASRVDELRDGWVIETVRMTSGEAGYKFIGRRTEPREKKAHCTTCYCYRATEPPDGQIGMAL